MDKKQLIIAWGLVAYIAGGLSVVILNLDTFIGILRFHLELLLPIIRTYNFILIVGLTLIYFLGKKKKFADKIRCSKCNKELLLKDAKPFLRRYWCKKHYLEAVESLSPKEITESRPKLNLKSHLPVLNKKQILVILLGIYCLLPFLFLMSGTLVQILKWDNQDYITQVYKAFPQFTTEQIDKAISHKRSHLRTDIFWLTTGLIFVVGAMASLCYRYRNFKSGPEEVEGK